MWNFLKKYKINNSSSLYEIYKSSEMLFLDNDPLCFSRIGTLLEQVTIKCSNKFGVYDTSNFKFRNNIIHSKMVELGIITEREKDILYDIYEIRNKDVHEFSGKNEMKNVIDYYKVIYNYISKLFCYCFNEKCIDFDYQYYSKILQERNENKKIVKNLEKSNELLNSELEKTKQEVEITKKQVEKEKRKINNLIKSNQNNMSIDDLNLKLIGENNSKSTIYNAICYGYKDFAISCINNKLVNKLSFNDDDIEALIEHKKDYFNDLYNIFLDYDLLLYFNHKFIKELMLYETNNKNNQICFEYLTKVDIDFNNNEKKIIANLLKNQKDEFLDYLYKNKKIFKYSFKFNSYIVSLINKSEVAIYINNIFDKEYLSSLSVKKIENDLKCKCDVYILKGLIKYEWGRKLICNNYLNKYLEDYKDKNNDTESNRIDDKIFLDSYLKLGKNNKLMFLEMIQNYSKKGIEKVLDLLNNNGIDLIGNISDIKIYDLSEIYLKWIISNKLIKDKLFLNQVFIYSCNKLNIDLYYLLKNECIDSINLKEIDMFRIRLLIDKLGDINLNQYEIIRDLYKIGIDVPVEILHRICEKYYKYMVKDMMPLLNKYFINLINWIKDVNVVNDFASRVIEKTTSKKLLFDILHSTVVGRIYKLNNKIKEDFVLAINNKGVYLCDYPDYDYRSFYIDLKSRSVSLDEIIYKNLNLINKLSVYPNEKIIKNLNTEKDEVMLFNSCESEYDLVIKVIDEQDEEALKRLKELGVNFDCKGKYGYPIDYNRKEYENDEIEEILKSVNYSEDAKIVIGNNIFIQAYLKDDYYSFEDSLYNYNKNRIFDSGCKISDIFEKNSDGKDIIDFLVVDEDIEKSNKYYRCINLYTERTYKKSLKTIFEEWGGFEFKTTDINKIKKKVFFDSKYFKNADNYEELLCMDVSYIKKELSDDNLLKNIIHEIIYRKDLDSFKKVEKIYSNKKKFYNVVLNDGWFYRDNELFRYVLEHHKYIDIDFLIKECIDKKELIEMIKKYHSEYNDKLYKEKVRNQKIDDLKGYIPILLIFFLPFYIIAFITIHFSTSLLNWWLMLPMFVGKLFISGLIYYVFGDVSDSDASFMKYLLLPYILISIIVWGGIIIYYNDMVVKNINITEVKQTENCTVLTIELSYDDYEVDIEDISYDYEELYIKGRTWIGDYKKYGNESLIEDAIDYCNIDFELNELPLYIPYTSGGMSSTLHLEKGKKYDLIFDTTNDSELYFKNKIID